MTTRIVLLRSIDDLQSLGDSWDELVRRSGADIYFRKAWITAWWAHFGQGRQFACVLAYQEDTLVAMLPFYLETLLGGIAAIRIARLAGMMHYFPAIKLPILDGVGPETLSRMFDGLLPKLGCHAISLSTISEQNPDLARLRAGLATLGGNTGIRDEVVTDHALIPLTPTFPAFMAGLSAKRRQKQRKSKKILEEAHGVHSVTLSGRESADFLAEFVQHHNTQWQATGRQGHFGDWPRNAAFFQEILTSLNGDPVGRFYVQRDGAGAFVGAQFCFVHGETCVAMLAARNMRTDLASLGVGYYGQLERVGDLISQQVKRIDSGEGEYDHKRSLGCQMVPLHRILIYPQNGPGRQRLRLLQGWAELVNLVYYRIWFLKLAPILRRQTRFGRSPLWTGWIRTRL